MAGDYILEPRWCSLRTFYLMSLMFGFTLATVVEKDFEFEDNVIENLKQSALDATLQDDEDFLDVEAGSGLPDGSGAKPTIPEEGYPEYYRVTVNFTNLIYTSNLEDRFSSNFNQLAFEISQAIANKLFEDSEHQATEPEHQPIVVNFTSTTPPFVIVTFDLGTTLEDKVKVYNSLNAAVMSGSIGPYTVSSHGFSFRLLKERRLSCPEEVGRKPAELPYFGRNELNLLVTNMFPCDGFVTSWEYYRGLPKGVAYASIWRQILDSDTKYILIEKSLLPVGPVGENKVDLKVPVRVKKGDFIGIHYAPDVVAGPIVGSNKSFSFVPANELYHNYRLQLHDDMLQKNTELDIDIYNFTLSMDTFALRALMDYKGIDVDKMKEIIHECEADQFTCKDRTCIPQRYRCDQQLDCKDESDEDGCPSPCSNADFRCETGECIPFQAYCDQHINCSDGSDEENCPLSPQCKPNEFRCIDGTCINGLLRCDSRQDCPDSSDEYSCPSIPCGPGEYRCEGGLCIDDQLRCDGRYDCPDTTDELDCPKHTCPPLTFTCNSGQCISQEKVCDNIPDCEDNSDESSFLCVPVPQRCLSGQFLCDNNTCVDESRKCDGTADCRDLTDELGCVRTCAPDEFQCADKYCINLPRRCNGIPECEDGSDEVGCPCTENEGECGDGTCYDLSKQCDGKQDCITGMDEKNCKPECTTDQHKCGDGLCVSRQNVCDRVADCADQSDEVNCPCRTDEFQCRDGQCIPATDKCNAFVNCRDGSDEEECTQRCRDDQFRCGSGRCINQRRRCDSRPDCADRSDEANCPPQRCRDDQFRCRSGRCIDQRRRCDSRPDCVDRSDEANCPLPTTPQQCRDDQFRCGSGRCIDQRRRCDSRPDCVDRSDEANCPQRCRDDQFRCGSGRCIDQRRRCDSRPDCVDRSDEANCPPQRCRDDQFRCGSGRCIDQRRRCDSRPDCVDRSDESDCPERSRRCPSDYFECGTGHCLQLSRRCDRISDCPDGSDEENCPIRCRPEEFQCVSGGHCINQTSKCNRRQDCPDNSDELDCPSLATVTVNPPLMRVRQGRRVVFDCQVIGGLSTTVSWKRRSNRPMSRHAVILNSHLEISEVYPEDVDDYICIATNEPGQPTAIARLEVDLPIPVTVSINPKTLQVREGEAIVLNCQATGEGSTTLRWSRRSNVRISPTASIVRGRLTILEVDVRDADDYICTAVEEPGSPSASATVQVDRKLCRIYKFRCDSGQCIDKRQRCNGVPDCVDHSDERNCFIGPTSRPSMSESLLCEEDKTSCSDGKCIPHDYVCDAEVDCTDGSDEVNCPDPRPCEPNEFKCRNGQCVMKMWRCDGDNDCGDATDEENCATSAPDAFCRMDEFQCTTGSQCVPASYQCDGEIDCQDRSDEIGCSVPVVILPPIPDITVEIGGTFSIICEAIGVPVPLIVWRLNWGNIPTGSRVVTSSANGRGMLTISQSVPEDAGAYTCEAINNKGSIFAIPDAIVVIRRQTGICTLPLFNTQAASEEECIQCFCFRRINRCFSSSLYRSQIPLGNQLPLVRRGDLTPLEAGYVNFNPLNREFSVADSRRALGSEIYYWSLPRQFLGNRLDSYGGDLTYKIHYEISGAPDQINEPDVIIKIVFGLNPWNQTSEAAAPTSLLFIMCENKFDIGKVNVTQKQQEFSCKLHNQGNDVVLHHRSFRQPQPSVDVPVIVPFRESSWSKHDAQRRGDLPISEYASREDLMQVLENVTQVLIRATYDNYQTLVSIKNVLMSQAVIQDTGRERAFLVEDCECPTGYAGLSCEKCAPGFFKTSRGPYGNCAPCRCNSHSNDCDPLTGQCLNCQHHTTGLFCNTCMDGYYGNPQRGTTNDCQPCPCPLTDPANRFSSTCELDRQGRVVCRNCSKGYTGLQCERCAQGYIGNPRNPGDFCKSIDFACDLRGSISADFHPLTNQCRCKSNAENRRCDECKPGTYYLSDRNPEGCISCFCMGVAAVCTSSSWSRTQIGSSFISDRAGFSLVNMMKTERVNTGFNVNPENRDLVYRNFYSLKPEIFYWNLPARFLSDKITAYGGYLRFTASYTPGRDNTPTASADVEITGNEITLTYTHPERFEPNTHKSFQVPIYEQYWRSVDGRPVTREYLLMALADLTSIMIRATYTKNTEVVTIRDVTLDIAEMRDTHQERALAVEQCSCPTGYRGLSCQECDSGYKRTIGGLYLGLCARCECNKHSSECDPKTGVCRNCQHNTEGENCERCATGYYGDASGGTTRDCQKCACPLTEPPNQFSPTCVLAADGKVNCTACPVGHTGRNCERCLPGYRGNPRQPGNYCKTDPINCDCDSRGTIPNTQCEPISNQCQCKAYVQGRRCGSCKAGYFYLDQGNVQGCLSCYCSDITSKCSSSNYYRNVIQPQFSSDGSHNFILTNRGLSRMIADGFAINADLNEIKFDTFNEIQKQRESLYFQLPPKFRGNMLTSYGGYLRFTLEFGVEHDAGRSFRETDVEIVSGSQRMYSLFSETPVPSEPKVYGIPLVESSFRLLDGSTPTREVFLSILANVDAILIRATYHTVMIYALLRDLSMENAVPHPTGRQPAPMVESCRCPEGYTGLSCQECATGYSRVRDQVTTSVRCIRCSCHGHSTTCEQRTGQCIDCQHNTEGDRCHRCAPGFYGDATVGTPNDCRPCACPLTIPSNSFSSTCYLAADNLVTCDNCHLGYGGRNCGVCSEGYMGNPRQVGGSCIIETVTERPNVTTSPLQLTEHIGTTVKFQCRVSGQGPFNIVWSRVDGRQLPPRARTGPRYELIITSVMATDSARYVCTASNQYGSSRGYVQLSVVPPDPIMVRVQEPKVQAVNEGTNVQFTCTVISRGRSFSYVLSWTKDGGRLPERATDLNGKLVIPDVRKEDSGTYTCTGSDPQGMHKDSGVLTVQVTDQPPEVKIDPRYQSVNAGDSAEFRCIAKGYPTPSIRWYRSGSVEISQSAIIKNGILHIPIVRKSDESEYYCEAVNAIGTARVRTILYVKGEMPTLAIIVRQSSVVASVGATVTLQCHSRDNGQVTLLWSRQTGLLPAGSSQQNGILTIPNAKPGDSGTYVCTGTTTTGRIGVSTATVTIKQTEEREMPTARMEPNSIKVPQGTTGTLRCIVTGKPTPTITWSRSMGQISSNHQINGNLLRITQATMADRGIYVCRAENVAGITQTSAIVEVERREIPSVKLHPSESQTISLGASTLFQCRLTSGIPPPKVTWMRAGGEAFTSNVQLLDNGVIQFNRVNAEDQGSYICTATNEVGTVSITATLNINGPPRISIIPGDEVRVRIGAKVRIECIGEGNPPPTVFWLGHRRTFPAEPRSDVEPISSAILEIEQVTRQHAGVFSCIAQNSGGRSEKRITLIVEDGPTTNGGVSTPRDITVVAGQKLELTCNIEGVPFALKTWKRRNGPLPPGHYVENGVLYFVDIQPEHQGEYICTSATDRGTFQIIARLIVIEPPKLTFSPTQTSTRPGEPLRLICRATGTPPIHIEWVKVDGIMSPSATERDGVLELTQITAADAGNYRCIAKNKAGTAEGTVLVSVFVRPSIAVGARQIIQNIGRTVVLECQVSGTPPPRVQWGKVDGSLPPRHEVNNGILTIRGLTAEDAGKYVCTATNEAGSVQDYIILKISETLEPTAQVASQTVRVGDRVEVDCLVTNAESSHISWSKLEGPITESAIYAESILIIPFAQLEDAGTYLCTATTPSGVLKSQISLFVRSQHGIRVPQDHATAALGTAATLGCNAVGFPQQSVTWMKKDGDLPSAHSIVDGNLMIPKVQRRDAGTYYCQGAHQHKTLRVPVHLRVTDLVPYFSQNPNSYMSYPVLKDAYLNFDILITFRPRVTDGLIMYNGQYSNAPGDFMCFGMRGRLPEFRFDVGSGPAIIKGNKTLELNKWHTVQLKRDRKEGTLIINNENSYQGTAPGRFQGLDLQTPLYIGSVPDYSTIPESAGYSQGFVGSISEMHVDGKAYNLGDDAIEVVGIQPYQTCAENSCQHGGSCYPQNSRYGFSCSCPFGYAGQSCELIGERCHPGACGNVGRCVNLPGLSGFRCVCPNGITGAYCQVGATVRDPAFNKTSFISYPVIQNGLHQLTLNLLIKLHSLDDGIILYNAQKENGNGDFISLAMMGGHLELQFNAGSGPAVLRSRNPLTVNEWTTVFVQRNGRDGVLIVNQEEPVTVRPGTYYHNNNYPRGDSSPGDKLGLNLKQPLFLGGTDPQYSVHSSVGTTDGFVGCVGELQVNARMYDLIKEAVESSNIVDCGEKRMCDRNPCFNNAVCEDISETNFMCLCIGPYTGERCEVEINSCTEKNPCQNGGLCNSLNGGYRCDCQLGFMGLNCKTPVQIGPQFQVGGNGFIQLHQGLLPHNNIQVTQNITFVMVTAESKGLLFWQADKQSVPLSRGDYLSVGLSDGHVFFSYELGSGPALIMSNFTVNDSLPHTIQVIRTGRSGILSVDNKVFTGQSKGSSQMLNVRGKIYIGGVPDLAEMTGGHFDTNFFGCIKNIHINNRGPLIVEADALSGFNIRPCES